MVRLYAAGPWERGRYLAMQLVHGPNLRELLATGELERAASVELLADVASALDAAHRAGIAHGSVVAENVLVDSKGRALLSDFGLAPPEPAAVRDRAEFAALVRECLGVHCPKLPAPESGSACELVNVAREALPAPVRTRGGVGLRRRWTAAVIAVGVCALTGAGLLVNQVGDSSNDRDRVPSVLRGSEALGSELPARGVGSVDCRGRMPDGASEGCTVVQTARPGRRLVPARPGTIRRWVVRGARGDVALQVIRRRGDRYVPVARSRFERFPGPGVHAVAADLPVRTGDRVGVQLAPGAAIGVRRGVPGATTARWIGPLLVEPRRGELGAGTGFDHELLLRVDYAPGAEPATAGRLRGRSAQRAPAGRELGSREVEVAGALRRVAVVDLGNAVAVDLFAGDRRLARLLEAGADPEGRLVWMTAAYGNPVLRWRNPDGRTFDHEYAVGARTLDRRR